MELHFLRPYWFIAVIPLIILCWRLSKLNLVENWRLLCDEHLLRHLLVVPKHKLSLPIVLLALGSLLTIVALAGPSWEKQAQPIYRSMLGRVFVLNLSPTMAASVGTVKKIDRARFKMLDYLNRQKEGFTGLVVYTDEANTISPLTEDNRTIANFVPALDPSIMPTFNDDTQTGLIEAGKLLQQAGFNSGNIILVTDKITNFAQTKKIASDLYSQGYHLFVYDISGQSADKEVQKIAAAGGGRVIAVTSNNDDIDELLSRTKSIAFVPPIRKTKENGIFWQDNGRALIFLILPLAVLAFRRGYL